jgi:hypothetical protein
VAAGKLGEGESALDYGQVIYADGGTFLMNPEAPPEIQIG